jgi:hypothetical protein
MPPEIYNRFMEPRITWHLTTVPSDEGITLHAYAAKYYDEHHQVIMHGVGSTVGHALEDLYRHLDQLGYDRSKLPTPEPETVEEEG